ncbi:hypothetical protein H8N03_07905 [Ramlibacter sp. USB13]|uniref:STAS/SEC14 domain-containing protein n=1 Tax=Ramlibacter cellulosilyticus TaxID=2764187 RepID=A0A923MQ95_9BURK|nr:hypothetical protein [Ramlibacter cellulosilyticus]MBC5782868.1 hypothetical protein [Ramlibacter cellulosilyticus]
MSTQVCVVRPPDFLRVRTDGQVDLDAGKELLARVAAAAGRLERYEVLIDIRDAVGRLSPDELHELAGSLITFRSTFLHRTAVLCPRERFDNARFFSLLAASYGFSRIRAFLDFEAAIDWLMEPEQP